MPSAKYFADRLRAHARLYRHIAEETWNADRSQELIRLADECMRAADAMTTGDEAAEAPHVARPM